MNSRWLGCAVSMCTLGIGATIPSYRVPLFFQKNGHQAFDGGGVRLLRGGFQAGAATVTFAGGRSAVPAGEDRLAATVTRITNQTAQKEPAFRKVRYTDVYPGIDAIFHGDRDRLEFDFAVA